MTDDYSTLQVEKHLSKETVFLLLFYITKIQDSPVKHVWILQNILKYYHVNVSKNKFKYEALLFNSEITCRGVYILIMCVSFLNNRII
jgi:hypothetical protein